MSDNWLIDLRKNPEARARLVCFPFAGGGVVPYYKWQQNLDEDIDLCAFNLPGRERLFGQQCITDYPYVIQKMCEYITGQATLPLIFFGHSFGGLSAFFVALELVRQNNIIPIHLFISARLPPTHDQLKKIAQLPPDEFKSMLIERYQGIPEPILQSPDLMKLFLPIIQNDFILYEQFSEVFKNYDNPAVQCAITSFGYKNDLPKEHEFAGWETLTTGEHRHIRLDGGHFEILQNPLPLIQQINALSQTYKK